MARDLFEGTVPYYVRYRVPYPEALLKQNLEKAAISGTGRMLDLGSGTGEIALRLAPEFQAVTAVEPDKNMRNAGIQKMQDQKILNIEWLPQTAEEFSAEANTFELVSIGAAFHWMDRPVLAQRMRDWLLPGQPLVILGYTSIWSGTADWLPLVRGVLHKWLGEKRRAGSGNYPELSQPHEQVLLEAGYRFEEIKYQQPQHWTLDDLIGNLYSTSFASPAVLGEKRNAFEADLRQTLLDYDSSGTYAEEMTFYALLAWPG
ncbi:ubiquinone/menaquinone biosynthesis methyltransferase [Gimesia panareensis]|uniref:Ubiquinone/menaquinone biosynthesis methyltransferase n=1 Tax=Gimesia panareensis TaxID=2527978 RepID=A0A518FUG5_9PLAN|nr:class I SAM-dependent methyltransferase [Gimesia panareensis]QDV19973.1 ubiquinone/menaquinone biosynthesis methyltransferase [Gimesia panareensis]